MNFGIVPEESFAFNHLALVSLYATAVPKKFNGFPEIQPVTTPELDLFSETAAPPGTSEIL